MIIDSSGVLIATYKASQADIKFKNEFLMSRVIAALLPFSEEIFARPQRLDLDSYAMSFYKFNIEDNYYYVVVALTDSIDNPKATKKLVLEIVRALEEGINSLIDVGLIITDQDLQEIMRSRISRISRKYIRFLASYRSGGVKSILTGTTVGTLANFITSILVFSIISLIMGVTYQGNFRDLSSLGFLVPAIFAPGVTVGISSGVVAGKPHEGAISGWLAYTMPILYLFTTTWIRTCPLYYALVAVAFNLIGISTLAATFGYIFGLWEDERKLSIAK